ncbi:Chromosome-partitioning ATPase Soj [compost metagenome]
MRVAVGNTKGGVGKSTTAVQKAIAQARKGRKVLLINADRQESALDSITAREVAGVLPAVTCIKCEEGADLERLLKEQSALFDDVIVDVGGRDSSAFRAALVHCDVLYVPTQPRAYDVWAMNDLAALLDQAALARKALGFAPLRALAGLTLADHGSLAADNRDAKKEVKKLPQVEFIDAPLRRRKAFWNASAQGLSVSELKPIDDKAVAELKHLMSIVFNS